MKRPRLVVVGDVMLDVDIEGMAHRLVPDSPAPILRESARQTRPGGAALAAYLASRSPDVEVTLVAPIPRDEAGWRLVELLGERLSVVALPCVGETTVKTRLRARGQTVARLDRGTRRLEPTALGPEARDALCAASAVLVSDYGGGVTAYPPLRELLAETAVDAPVVWDPHPRGGPPVPGVLLATPNETEAAVATGAVEAATLAEVRRQAAILLSAWQATCVVVTRGSHGALMCVNDGSASVFPAPAAVSGDACGAGDCFAATVTTALSTGRVPSEAVAAGVAAATAFVSSGGVATLDQEPIEPPPLEPGVLIPAEHLVAATRSRGGTIVATGGCFDLLHAGHIQTLAAARSLGDCLVVCLNSDESVRRLKGPGRPIQPVADRARVLSSIRYVDAVHVFAEDTPAQALRALRPDIWIKGGDYVAADLPEARVLAEWNGEVLTVPYLQGRSTSSLAELVRG
jgi:rfaE bifunctional protein nucleotidyltransferase chain/domain/rfaE bifunctional protein kinase chain/domain